MRKLWYIIGILSLLTTSCQDEDKEMQKLPTGNKVIMHFQLKAKQPTQSLTGAADTRSVVTLPAESVMKDLMVMQFAGIGDDAPLIGTPQYFPAYDSEVATMSFISSVGSEEHTVFFVANIGEDMGSKVIGKTLGDFKRLTHAIPHEIKLIDGQGLLMTGSWTGVITHDGSVKEVLLTRALARLSFHLNKSSLSAQYYIRSVSVENVPSAVGYTSDNTSIPQITYTTSTYDNETDYTWYLPENKNSIKEKSTCIVVTLGQTNSPMAYPCRIYTNATEDTPDYTLLRNHSYDLTTNLKGTTTVAGEYLIDCHYEDVTIAAPQNAIVTASANWIDVSMGAWSTGLTQTITATGGLVHLHVDENISETERTAEVTITDGMTTTTIPIKQTGIKKVGFFGTPDVDGIYTTMLGMECVEENTRMTWTTAPNLSSSGFEVTDQVEVFNGQPITAKYGMTTSFEAFNDCYKKNRDKSKIEWYLPAQAQLLGMYVGQNANKLKTSGGRYEGGYYSVTIPSQGFPIFYAFAEGFNALTGFHSRNTRCVRNLP